MLGGNRQTRVYAYNQVADLRKGFDGLYSLVINVMNHNPLTGDMYLFVSRNRKRAKVIYWDGTGLCIFSKRMEKGFFIAPWNLNKGRLKMTVSELSLLIEGAQFIGKKPLSPPEIILK